MMISGHSATRRYRLHVPLVTARGQWLEIGDGRGLTILGYSATFHTRQLKVSAAASSDPTMICHWICFEPMQEAHAKSLLADLEARLPVLALRGCMYLRVAPGDLQNIDSDISVCFDGASPAIIAESCKAHPSWVSGSIVRKESAEFFFSTELDQCPAVSSERLRTALDLAGAALYDTLPRSIFLSQLTILDSLAVHGSRDENVVEWLSEKIKEAHAFGDPRLISGLGNLKSASHGFSIEELVGRASRAVGESSEITGERKRLATRLYSVRSKLSHVGKARLEPEDGEQARNLATWVLQTAIEHPDILEDEKR